MRKILVADDEDIHYNHARILLKDDEVIYVGDPDKVEEAAREGNFDAILLDLYWQEEGRSLDDARAIGYSLLEKVRGLAPRVILWTSAPRHRNEERALETGATEFLSKDDIRDLARTFDYPVSD